VPDDAVHTDTASPVLSTDDPTARRDLTGSDHRSVLATITI
jgi:hypothetical protein